MDECPETPIPDEVVEWDGHLTTGQSVVRGMPRSVAHLEFTSRRAAARGNTLKVIQSAWHRGTDASKGTHDFDAVYDVMVEGLSFPRAQTFMRRWGWAAWFRPQTFNADGTLLWNDHVHAVSIGCGTTPCVDVGLFVPGQLTDYKNKALGLADQHTPGSDKSFFPEEQFVFDFDAWLKGGDDLQFEDQIPGTHAKEVGEALATIFDIDRRTKNILNGIHRAVGEVGSLRDEVVADQGLDADRQSQLLAKIDRVRDRLLDAIADDAETAPT